VDRRRLSDEDVQLSIRKLFRQPEARPLVEYLQAVVDEIGPSETCALHAHNERRKFASELIAAAVTARESESDGSDDKAGQDGRTAKHGAGKRRNRRHGPAGR
jgi:hypothetical protein